MGAAFGCALPARPPRTAGDAAARAVRTAGALTEATVTPALAAMSPAVSAAEPAKSTRIPMVHPLHFWIPQIRQDARLSVHDIRSIHVSG